ncbi:MAG: L,D-transpeptidase [Bacteriovoracaceae bacterium]|nr:L,D-transpeptidase [Bacteriovoracaceae bacterium]
MKYFLAFLFCFNLHAKVGFVDFVDTAAPEFLFGPNPNPEIIQSLIEEVHLVIVINKSTLGPDAQTLTMYESGEAMFRTKISTGREKEEINKTERKVFTTTPTGVFRPTRLYTEYHSKSWDGSMPNAVFFNGGIAIHGTYHSEYRKLGSRASAGCIRMRQEEAKFVRIKIMNSGRGITPDVDYTLVQEEEKRLRVSDNTVQVSAINTAGTFLEKQIYSWDTLIIVHEDPVAVAP